MKKNMIKIITGDDEENLSEQDMLKNAKKLIQSRIQENDAFS